MNKGIVEIDYDHAPLLGFMHPLTDPQNKGYQLKKRATRSSHTLELAAASLIDTCFPSLKKDTGIRDRAEWLEQFLCTTNPSLPQRIFI